MFIISKKENMKNLMILILCLSVLGCEDEVISPLIDISKCFSPELGSTESEQLFYNFLEGDINFNSDENPAYSIVNGSDEVFIYRHIYENLSNVIDDEYEERILFQVEPDLKSFSIKSENEFSNANCIFGACGNSYPSVLFRTISGSIEGDKVSDMEWQVVADLTIEKFNGGTSKVEFNEVFINLN